MSAPLSLACKWKCGPEDCPYEVRIERYSAPRTGIKASLVSGDVTVNYKTVDAVASFQRCVWKCNDFPQAAPLETRFFRNLTNKSAILIGVSFSDQTLHVKYFPNFDDIQLKDHALVFNTAARDTDGYTMTTLSFLSAPNPEPYDAHAEEGMVRFSPPMEERVVHIWDRVGQDGIADLRLIHTIDRSAAGAPKEALMLELFNRSKWLRTNVTLNNQDLPLIDSSIPIGERINFFKCHEVVILGGRTGNAYRNVTLSSKADVPTEFQGFMQGKNLQSALMTEIATYIRDELFVIKAGNQIVGEVTCRTRVQVKRKPGYDFGGHHGKLDAICIHLSRSAWRDLGTPWDMFVAFGSGLLNRDAPKIHQLKGLDKTGMQDLFQENSGVVIPLTDTQKTAIFQEFNLAVAAGANVNYYIAENRKTARLEVGGAVLTLCSGAVSAGRFWSFRWIWEKNTPPPPHPNRAADVIIAASANNVPPALPQSTPIDGGAQG